MSSVTAEDQEAMKDYPVRGDICHRVAKNAMVGAEGLPLGVQVTNIYITSEISESFFIRLLENIIKRKWSSM